MTKAKGFTVKEGRIELIAPNGTTFIYPPAGRGTYATVMGKIDAAGLVIPTFGDTIVLTHAAWQNPEEKYSQKIIRLMQDSWLLADTGILYVPEDGVYFQDHPATDKNGWPKMNAKTLDERIRGQDPSVRFTEYNYQVGEMSAQELASSPFFQSLVGNKQIVELGKELADEFPYNPRLWALNKVDRDTVRLAPLGADCDGYWLCVGGCIHGSGGVGFALGIAPAEE